MQLETMGRPAVLVATARFADFARECAVGGGLPSARIAVVEHPLGGIAPEAVAARARAAVEQVLELLRSGGRT